MQSNTKKDNCDTSNTYENTLITGHMHINESIVSKFSEKINDEFKCTPIHSLFYNFENIYQYLSHYQHSNDVKTTIIRNKLISCLSYFTAICSKMGYSLEELMDNKILDDIK